MALLGGLRQRQLRAVEIAADELHDLRGRVAQERPGIGKQAMPPAKSAPRRFG
jgi:hypothetical protein